MLWGTVKETPERKRQRAFYFKCTFPCVVLEWDFVPPMQTFAFNLWDMFILVECEKIATEPNLVKGYANCYSQCILNLYMASCLDFVLFQI